MSYLPTLPIFDFQDLQKLGHSDFLKFQPTNTAVQVFSLQIDKKISFIDLNHTYCMNGSWISVPNAVHSQSTSIFLHPRFSSSNEPTGLIESFVLLGEGRG